MDAFSFLATFLVLIPGLALARVLSGTADLVRHGLTETPGTVRWSGLFVLMAALLVLLIALQWWVLFNWHDEPPYPFALFAFLLVAPSGSLFVAHLMIPDVALGADVDLERHYFAVARWVFPAIAFMALLDIPDTFLHGPARVEEVGGVAYVAKMVASSAAIAALGVVRRRVVHWVVLPAIVAAQTWQLLVAGIGSLG